MAKKKFYDRWEYNYQNDVVEVYLDDEEIDGIDLKDLVEDWLEEKGYKERE